MTVRLALEQTDGAASHFSTQILPDSHPQAAGNFTYLERITKFLLWSRGGFRLHLDGPAPLAAKLAAHYRETPTGKFDSSLVGEQLGIDNLQTLQNVIQILQKPVFFIERGMKLGQRCDPVDIRFAQFHDTIILSCALAIVN